MNNILILKDNYNSFEQYYLDKLNRRNCQAVFYYKNSTLIRKLFTHLGLPFESVWYGEWKKKLDTFDCIIVFDSLHSANLLKYIHKRYKGRLIFWHWNPVIKEKDKKILRDTKDICEHWTFNPEDADRYGMVKSNQFFFRQEQNEVEKNNSVFFVGTDKGRYNKIFQIGKVLKKMGVLADFHVVSKINGDNREYIEESFIEYDRVLAHIQKSKAVLEIVQEGQNGLTARTLEAMFFNTKLITNNLEVRNFEFYRKNNIYIIGYDKEDALSDFLQTEFQPLGKEDLFKYEADGWLENFVRI